MIKLLLFKDLYLISILAMQPALIVQQLIHVKIVLQVQII